jgi:hypothetical protein
MKYSDIFELLYKNDISLNVTICSGVGIDEEERIQSVFYNRKKNKLVLSQYYSNVYGKAWEKLK